MDYVELRCRSAFSFLAGASPPEDLVARAAALGYPVLALGDRDGVYGAPRFHQAARRAGLRALIGCALSISPVTAHSLTGSPAHASCTSLYLLVAERAGYRHLCRLLTDAKQRAPKGESRAFWQDLEGRSEGLVCLAGGADGPLAEAVRRGDEESAGAILRRLQGLFPDRLYVDLQRHLDPAEERLNRALSALARRHGVPLVATNDVRHARRAGARCSTCSPACATRRRSTPPGGELLRQRRAPPQAAARDGGAVPRSARTRSPTRGASPSAASSPSPISATASPTIRCRPARRRSASCAR